MLDRRSELISRYKCENVSSQWKIDVEIENV